MGSRKHNTFKQIKYAFVNPPVLVPLVPGKPVKMYIVAKDESIGFLLAQDIDDGMDLAES